MDHTASSTAVLRRLQVEWQHLRVDRRSLRRAHEWRIVRQPFDTLDDLLAAAGFGRVRSGSHDDDPVLAALLVRGRSDQLAARIVLQRLLPGLAAIARRRSRTSAERADVTDELILAAWAVIRTYPVERRPHFVAANLLRAIQYEALRRHHRRPTLEVVLHSDGVLDGPAPDAAQEPLLELASVLREAAEAGLDPDDLALARRLGRGDSTVAIARDLGVTDRAVRYRRTTVTYRLANVVALPA